MDIKISTEIHLESDLDVNVVKNACLNYVEILGIIWVLRMFLFGQELYHILTEISLNAFCVVYIAKKACTHQRSLR